MLLAGRCHGSFSYHCTRGTHTALSKRVTIILYAHGCTRALYCEACGCSSAAEVFMLQGVRNYPVLRVESYSMPCTTATTAQLCMLLLATPLKTWRAHCSSPPACSVEHTSTTMGPCWSCLLFARHLHPPLAHMHSRGSCGDRWCVWDSHIGLLLPERTAFRKALAWRGCGSSLQVLLCRAPSLIFDSSSPALHQPKM